MGAKVWPSRPGFGRLGTAKRVRYDERVTRPIARVAPLFFVATTALLVWPLYPWLGNTIEPRVLGLPWSLVYVLLVIVVNAVVLTWLYVARVVDATDDGDDRGGAGGG
jgi:hypothetical protein